MCRGHLRLLSAARAARPGRPRRPWAPRLRCPPSPPPLHPQPSAPAPSPSRRTSQLAGQTPPPPIPVPPGSPGWCGTQLAGDLILAERLGATLVLGFIPCGPAGGDGAFIRPGPLPWAGTGCLPVWRIECGEQKRGWRGGVGAEDPPKAASCC